jgi:hypothetical protein
LGCRKKENRRGKLCERKQRKTGRDGTQKGGDMKDGQKQRNREKTRRDIR